MRAYSYLSSITRFVFFSLLGSRPISTTLTSGVKPIFPLTVAAKYLTGNTCLTGEAGLTAPAVIQRSGHTAAPPRSMEDKVRVLKEHVLASIQWCGNDERKGIVHSRRHFAASPVFKGLDNFKQTRIALLRAETVEEVFSIMDTIVQQWGNQS